MRGAYVLPCGGFIGGVAFVTGGALLWLAAVGFTISGADSAGGFAP